MDKFLLAFSFIFLISSTTKLLAEEKPDIEIGVALAGQVLNDYRGSKEYQSHALPLPILNYQGKRLKADRKGVRAEFFANKRWELNLSAETALNGASDDNELRMGMPELDSAFEIGPSLNVNLTGEDFSEGWQLRMPVRAVFTFSSKKVSAIGYTFNPKFTYTKRNLMGDWIGRSSIGLLYGSKDYHDYYYTVEDQYATSWRPAYEADAGFSGSYLKTSIFKRKNDFIYGFSLRYDNLSGTTFEDSPLVETDHYFSFTFALVKMFWHN